MTARVMIVPGMLLFFEVLGTTFAARNCCLPFFAKSPLSSTVVSAPSRDCAPAWMSSGTAGFAGAAGAGAGSDFVSAGFGESPQLAAKLPTIVKMIAHDRTCSRCLRAEPPFDVALGCEIDERLLRSMDETPNHKDGEDAALLAVVLAALVADVRLHPSMVASAAASAIAESLESRAASQSEFCIGEFIRD